MCAVEGIHIICPKTWLNKRWNRVGVTLGTLVVDHITYSLLFDCIIAICMRLCTKHKTTKKSKKNSKIVLLLCVAPQCSNLLSKVKIIRLIRMPKVCLKKIKFLSESSWTLNFSNIRTFNVGQCTIYSTSYKNNKKTVAQC